MIAKILKHGIIETKNEEFILVVSDEIENSEIIKDAAQQNHWSFYDVKQAVSFYNTLVETVGVEK